MTSSHKCNRNIAILPVATQTVITNTIELLSNYYRKSWSAVVVIRVEAAGIVSVQRPGRLCKLSSQ